MFATESMITSMKRWQATFGAQFAKHRLHRRPKERNSNVCYFKCFLNVKASGAQLTNINCSAGQCQSVQLSFNIVAAGQERWARFVAEFWNNPCRAGEIKCPTPKAPPILRPCRAPIASRDTQEHTQHEAHSVSLQGPIRMER